MYGINSGTVIFTRQFLSHENIRTLRRFERFPRIMVPMLTENIEKEYDVCVCVFFFLCVCARVCVCVIKLNCLFSERLVLRLLN